MPKRILVVAHYPPLKASRVTLLERKGYRVESVESDDEAMALLETQEFDLILIGRNSMLAEKGLAQRLREKYPNLLTLRIEDVADSSSIYPSRLTDSAPSHVISALHEMLGDALRVVSLSSPVDSH